MWTYEDDTNFMSNAILRRHYNGNGQYAMAELIPVTGYALHDINETEEPIMYYLTVSTSPNNEQYLLDYYEAVLITPGMIIVGVPNPTE